MTRVIDGDTFEVSVDWLPKELGKHLTIRILGVDTPEKAHRAKCEEERELGEAATNFSKYKFQSAKVKQVEIKNWDKFGGRILGDIILDGERISDMLIKQGFAKPYDGKRKHNWCQ